MRIPLCSLLFLACIATRQSAQPSLFLAGEHRTISISGEGTVQAAPDMVEVELQTVTENPDLMIAKRENDLRISKVEEIAKSYGLKPEDVRIEYDSIDREISYAPKTKHRLISYSVKKRVNLTVRDLGRFETLLNELFNAGVNKLEKVEFKNSRSQFLAAQARELAVKAARDKAVAMAAVLGQRVGKPLGIADNAADRDDSVNGIMASAGGVGSFRDPVSSTETVVPETAAGTLNFSASVSVVFELE